MPIVDLVVGPIHGGPVHLRGASHRVERVGRWLLGEDVRPDVRLDDLVRLVCLEHAVQRRGDLSGAGLGWARVAYQRLAEGGPDDLLTQELIDLACLTIWYLSQAHYAPTLDTTGRAAGFTREICTTVMDELQARSGRERAHVAPALAPEREGAGELSPTLGGRKAPEHAGQVHSVAAGGAGAAMEVT